MRGPVHGCAIGESRALDPDSHGATRSRARPGQHRGDPSVVSLEAITSEAEDGLGVDELERREREDFLSAVREEIADGGSFDGIEPLPPPPRPKTHSHRCRARWRRALEVWAVAERTRLVLNNEGTSRVGTDLVLELRRLDRGNLAVQASHGAVPQRLRAGGTSADVPLQRKWQLRVIRRAAELTRSRRAFRLTGATPSQWLRRSRPDEYVGLRGLPTPYVPLTATLLAEPALGEPSVAMEDVLVGTQGEYMLSEELTMKPEEEVKVILARENPRYTRILGARGGT